MKTSLIKNTVIVFFTALLIFTVSCGPEIANIDQTQIDSNEQSLQTYYPDFELYPVIIDFSTGLMWQQHQSSNILNWSQANNYCETLSLSGYEDWRLADVHEYINILDGCSPSFNGKDYLICNSCDNSNSCNYLFPFDVYGEKHRYWTSTDDNYWDMPWAWEIDLAPNQVTGKADIMYAEKTKETYARCVRNYFSVLTW